MVSSRAQPKQEEKSEASQNRTETIICNCSRIMIQIQEVSSLLMHFSADKRSSNNKFRATNQTAILESSIVTYGFLSLSTLATCLLLCMVLLTVSYASSPTDVLSHDTQKGNTREQDKRTRRKSNTRILVNCLGAPMEREMARDQKNLTDASEKSLSLPSIRKLSSVGFSSRSRSGHG